MTMRRFMRIYLFGVAFASITLAQVGTGATPPPPQPAPSSDPLGRDTPRGTVLGFLKASRKGDFETARRYLNAPLGGGDHDDLARKLAVVLDRRLPPRLNQLSSLPEGSHYFPAQPDSDLVGTIERPEGNIEITVQRVKLGRTWRRLDVFQANPERNSRAV